MPKALRKRTADEMEQLKQAAMLLRWRTTEPVANNSHYMTYPKIAKAISVTVNQAVHLCRYVAKVKSLANLEK